MTFGFARDYDRKIASTFCFPEGHFAVGVVCIFLMWASGASLAHAQIDDTPQIIVSGEGRVAAEPDMATVTLGVQREADTAEGAVAAMSDGAAGVLSAIEATGIEARDIQTSGLTLSPRYARPERQSDDPPRIVGYRAETSLTVRVRDLDSLAGVLDAVVRDGANLFRGISFGLADPDSLQAEAQRRAVADATAQAARLAEAAGVGLGRVLRLESDGGRPRPQMMRSDAMMAEAAPVPIAAGEVSLTAHVRMVFEIE